MASHICHLPLTAVFVEPPEKRGEWGRRGEGGGGVGPEMDSGWRLAGVSRVSELVGELELCWS